MMPCTLERTPFWSNWCFNTDPHFLYPEDEGNKFLRNPHNYPQNYKEISSKKSVILSVQNLSLWCFIVYKIVKLNWTDFQLVIL